MKENFNILPLKGLEKTDIETYRNETGLPAGNGRMLYFYLTGLIAERERERALIRNQKITLAKTEGDHVVRTTVQHGREVNKPANQSNPEATPTATAIRGAIVAAAQKGQPKNVTSMHAWRAETERQQEIQDSRESRNATLAHLAAIAFTPADVESAYETLERRACDVAHARMQVRARIALVLQKHAAEFFPNDPEGLETAMCFVLAAPVIRADLTHDSAGRAIRAQTYGTRMATIAHQMGLAEKDPEFIKNTQCTPETQAIVILSAYDLLANQLRDAKGISALGPGERVHTMKFCLMLERTANEAHPDLWQQIQCEARRVRLAISHDRNTSRELKREMGVP